MFRIDFNFREDPLAGMLLSNMDVGISLTHLLRIDHRGNESRQKEESHSKGWK